MLLDFSTRCAGDRIFPPGKTRIEMNISVIIPTYRRPQLLKRCVDALLSQQIETPYEIIVVIDGPSENIELPDHHRVKNVRIVTTGKNGGPAAARNYGFIHATGELIVFTDDDCIPGPKFLSAYWSAYLESKYSNVAFTGKVHVPLAENPTDYERNIKQLETAEFLTANCAINRNAFNKVGGFDEKYKMAWREDSDLHFSLLQHGVPVMHVAKAEVQHPVRDAKWNVSLHSERKNMFNALLYKKFPSYYSQRIGSKPPLSYYAIAGLVPLTMATAVVSPYFAMMMTLIWIMLVLNFAMSRICRSSGELSHVVSMLVTSMLIPFLSIYWNLYGNIKFRSRLL
jgi:GT2 family glycosyltransferase